MSISFTPLEPETTTVDVIPPSYNSGELPSGANPTSTSIYSIPIPQNSDVLDMSVTFRDRRSVFDDDRRTVPTVNANKTLLETNIVGWTSSNIVFNGVTWRRHRRVYAIDNTTYEYFIHVHFTSSEMMLMLTGTHVGNTNSYGGWENLIINFAPITSNTSVEEVVINELIGSYIPTVSERTAVNITTGIDMSGDEVMVLITVAVDDGNQRTVIIDLDQRLNPSSDSAVLPNSSIIEYVHISPNTRSTGEFVFLNTNSGNIHVLRIDVYQRKTVKILR